MGQNLLDGSLLTGATKVWYPFLASSGEQGRHLRRESRGGMSGTHCDSSLLESVWQLDTIRVITEVLAAAIRPHKLGYELVRSPFR